MLDKRDKDKATALGGEKPWSGTQKTQAATSTYEDTNQDSFPDLLIITDNNKPPDLFIPLQWALFFMFV